jgi:hypothetical protein
MWANGRSSLTQGQHPANKMPAKTVAVEGVGKGEGGGPLSVATEKNVKIAKVHSITSYFGHEDMIKTKLFIKVHEKSKNKNHFTIENFKISQLE